MLRKSHRLRGHQVLTVVEERVSPAPSGAGARTVATLAKEWAERAPTQVALREKDYGIWQEYDWATTWDLIETAGHGLLALGADVGDRVSIHAEDRPEWVILDLATVAVRGVTVGLYPTNPAAEVEYMLGDCTPVVHLVEDQEQVDKVFEIGAEKMPSVTKLIYCEPRGFSEFSDDRLIFWDDFLEQGRQHRQENPGAVATRMAEATDDDVMTLVYTSGTTGPPKGAMLSNANSMFAIEKIINEVNAYPDETAPNASDQILTYLPLCHVAERIFSTWTMLGGGPTLNFAESIETVPQNLREVQPTLFFAVPRIWERLHAGVLIRGGDATFFKKIWLNTGMKAANAIGRDKVANGGNHTTKSRVLNAIFYPLVFRALQERVGLRHCRRASSGAAPIAPEVLEFFMGIGVPVFELYGMTENSAVATCNFPGRIKLGTVGEPYADIGLRIDEQTGEVQTKHPGNFQGYWNKPEKTAETFTEDGWLRTGDVGEWVDGSHVKIVDRMKDIIITSGGKNISPSEIENSLKASPFIKEAMVIGDGRKYLTALVAIELDVVGDWALRKNLPYTTYRDLSEKPEVIEMVQKIVDETNEKFARVEGIKKFRMIPKELDHEDGELTATQKLKRSAMVDMFGDLVESMY
ncbi:MAG: AMP-binding protein [Acidimicrobiales bacterium]|nr:AMP-binding protein [Acidimicrobiales bacterium]RZV43655.1 MAG: long-chain fatty acid--CoA ligase [Acidimicrobiales bacterium]